MISQDTTPKFESEFRVARLEDLESLLALYQQLHTKEEPVAIDSHTKQVWNEILEDPRLYCFVISQGPKLLASCVLDIVPNLTRGGRPFGVLQNVVTDSELRGRGLGSQLIGDTLKFAWDKNSYQVLVQTGRPETVSFYRKQGFRDDSKIGLVAKPGWQTT